MTRRSAAGALEKDPAELEPGRLGCPRCRRPLVPGTAPYCYKGRRLGPFDGIVCGACGCGLLAENGHKDADRAVEAPCAGGAIEPPA